MAALVKAVSVIGGSGLFCCGASLLYLSKKEQEKHHNLEWDKFLSTPREMVTTGPYKYSRNPVYLSYITMTAAAGVFSLHRIYPKHFPYSAYMILPVMIPSAIVYISLLIVISDEEHRMMLLFGREYLQYKQSVHKWIGISSSSVNETNTQAVQ